MAMFPFMVSEYMFLCISHVVCMHIVQCVQNPIHICSLRKFKSATFGKLLVHSHFHSRHASLPAHVYCASPSFVVPSALSFPIGVSVECVCVCVRVLSANV